MTGTTPRLPRRRHLDSTRPTPTRPDLTRPGLNAPKPPLPRRTGVLLGLLGGVSLLAAGLNQSAVQTDEQMLRNALTLTAALQRTHTDRASGCAIDWTHHQVFLPIMNGPGDPVMPAVPAVPLRGLPDTLWCTVDPERGVQVALTYSYGHANAVAVYGGEITQYDSGQPRSLQPSAQDPGWIRARQLREKIGDVLLWMLTDTLLLGAGLIVLWLLNGALTLVRAGRLGRQMDVSAQGDPALDPGASFPQQAEAAAFDRVLAEHLALPGTSALRQDLRALVLSRADLPGEDPDVDRLMAVHLAHLQAQFSRVQEIDRQQRRERVLNDLQQRERKQF